MVIKAPKRYLGPAPRVKIPQAGGQHRSRAHHPRPGARTAVLRVRACRTMDGRSLMPLLASYGGWPRQRGLLTEFRGQCRPLWDMPVRRDQDSERHLRRALARRGPEDAPVRLRRSARALRPQKGSFELHNRCFGGKAADCLGQHQAELEARLSKLRDCAGIAGRDQRVNGRRRSASDAAPHRFRAGRSRGRITLGGLTLLAAVGLGLAASGLERRPRRRARSPLGRPNIVLDPVRRSDHASVHQQGDAEHDAAADEAWHQVHRLHRHHRAVLPLTRIVAHRAVRPQPRVTSNAAAYPALIDKRRASEWLREAGYQTMRGQFLNGYVQFADRPGLLPAGPTGTRF